MGLNKRLIGGAAAVVPTNTDNFDIVTYTGTGGTYSIEDGVEASVTINSGTANYARGSVSHSTGKRYFEVKYIAAPSGNKTLMVGIINTAYVESWTNAQTKMYYAGNGNKYTGGTGTSYGATYVPGDIIGVAYDGTNRTVTFYKNNVSQGTAFTGLITNYPSYFAAIGTGLYSETAQFRFTSSEFTYTPPSGYSEWGSGTVSANSGTVNSARAAQPIDFQPDLVWIKARNTTQWNGLYDSIRGAGKWITSNATNTEADTAGTTLTSFDSNGFSLGDDTNGYGANTNGNTYVAWCCKAGGAAVSGTGTNVTNVEVSPNTDAGFSIVKYNYQSSSAATISHGLDEPPEMIILKAGLDASTASSWFVYHSSLGASQEIYLNAINAAATDPNRWNNTSPTSSVFSIGTSFGSYPSYYHGNHIAYCFHSVDGYQKVGSYSGSGGAGNAQALGFAPRWIMLKATNATTNWAIFDTARPNKRLQADLSNAEGDDTRVVLTSTGFEFTGAAFNESGRDWIYLAIA
jgi:hypothetical protein